MPSKLTTDICQIGSLLNSRIRGDCDHSFVVQNFNCTPDRFNSSSIKTQLSKPAAVESPLQLFQNKTQTQMFSLIPISNFGINFIIELQKEVKDEVM